MTNIKRGILSAILILVVPVFTACSFGAENEEETGISYEIIGKTESGDTGTFTNGINHITDQEMLQTAVQESGADVDIDSVNFDESHVFQISVTENGCGYLLENVENDGGLLKFMFELTPVVEEGEDPQDVACSEIAIPSTFFVQTEAVDFESLEIYASGEKL
ncbi:hypothetical protein [Salinicoccus albus]|uniref:hypothetical protein n=1 Tax=Salinicoccus albus TaxID=418756 RepID=UPI00035F465D|nr:hypothetical protein [Salinicoccus albus]